MTNSLQYLFQRDLSRLGSEISLYPSEEQIWQIKDDISNSAGNLCLHLIGNLNHFISHVLGGSDYLRNREFEFKGKGVPREELLNDISACAEMLNNVLGNLSEEDLQENFPIQLFDTTYSKEQMLLHLYGHFNYHLGQINYHRRLIAV